jgi:NAD(P)-dependent dehydrogenase (short-subunit alcohol dehydrogenase family)
MGGEAFVHGADVSNQDQVADMVKQTMKRWGRIDILVNNAGILLDKTFAKMPMADFRKVVDVHLIGSANCCHAVWPIMREQKFGRIVLTSSASGLYGNFGQSNYGAAKAAMVGLMNVLHHEGARDDIRINTLAPTAATRMTENLLPPESLELLAPETITPGLLYLVSEDGPSKTILSAGAGVFAQTRVYETIGTMIEGDITPEAVAQNWDKISDPKDQEELQDAFSQTRKYAKRAAEAHNIKLDW